MPARSSATPCSALHSFAGTSLAHFKMASAFESRPFPRDELSPPLHRLHDLVGTQHRMRQVRVVDERRGIAVTPRRMLGRGGGVLDYRDLEPLLDQFAQV